MKPRSMLLLGLSVALAACSKNTTSTDGMAPPPARIRMKQGRLPRGGRPWLFSTYGWLRCGGETVSDQLLRAG